MAETVERLYRLVVDGGPAINQLDRIAKSAEQVDSRMAKMGAAMKGALAGAAIGGAIVGIVNGFKAAADSMDDMVKAAQKSGVAVESLSALSYAASQSGVSFDGLQTSLKKLNANLADVDTGTSEAAKSLRALGVSGADSAEMALNKIADGFASVPDSAQKSALALAIFGKAGVDMIPMLNAGADGIKELTDRAERLGLVINEEAGKQAELFNDSLADLGLVTKGISQQITAGMLPALSGLVSALADSASAGDGWKDLGRGLGEIFVWLADKANKLAATFQGLGVLIGGSLAAISAAMSGNFAGAREVMGAVVTDINAIEARVKRQGEAMQKSLSGMGLPEKTVKGTEEGAGRMSRAFDALRTSTDKAGKAAKELPDDPFTKWQKGLVSTMAELDAIPAKVEFLTQSIRALEASGQGSGAWAKVLRAELEKITSAQWAETLKGMSDFEKGMQSAAEAITKTATEAEKLAGVRTVLEQIKEADYGKYLDLSKSFNIDLAPVDAVQAKMRELIQDSTRQKEILAEIDELIKNGLDPEFGAKLKAAFGEAQEGALNLKQAFTDLTTNAVSGFVDKLFDGKTKFSEAITSMMTDLGKLIIKMLAVKAIEDSMAMFGMGKSNGFWSSIGGLFGGARALGGPVAANTAYLVGERGPELFVPRGAGDIINNSDMRNMSRRQTSVTVNQYISGGNAQQIKRAAGTGAREVLGLIAQSQRYA